MTGETGVQRTEETVGRFVHLNGIVILNAIQMIKATTLAVFTLFRIEIVRILASKAYVLI